MWLGFSEVVLALTHRGCHNLNLARLKTEVLSCASASTTENSKRQGLIQNQAVLELLLELKDLVKGSNVAQILRDAFHNDKAAIEAQPAVQLCQLAQLQDSVACKTQDLIAQE